VTELGTRKGFYFQRLDGGRVRIRVKVDEREMPSDDRHPLTSPVESIPVFREVELTAAEWVDVVRAVSTFPSGPLGLRQAVDLHMGPPPGRPPLDEFVGEAQ
jgi:hypothetical protein